MKDIDSEKTCLIVVDMLNDFVREGGALVVPDAKELIAPQQMLLERAREEGIKIVYLADHHLPDDDEFSKWPPHAIRGTEGAEVIDELRPEEEDRLIPKRRYSGFFGTELDLILRENDIENVILVGVLTDICVMYTSADASARGYNVTVVEDATASVTKERHQFALNHMKEVHGTTLMITEEILELME